MWAVRLTALGAVALVPGTVALGCKEKSTCEKACARVAACKERVKQGGDPILGERAPPPDPACMHKCKTRPDEFAKCEAQKRTCEQLRGCRGEFR